MKKTLTLLVGLILIFAVCSACETGTDKPTESATTSLVEATTQIDLLHWLGEYFYEETAEDASGTSSHYAYVITLYNLDEEIQSTVEVRNITFDEPIFDLNAIVEGDEKEIRIRLTGSLPGRHISTAAKGDILVTFSMKDITLYTKWGALTPMALEYEKEGMYFKREG